MNLLHPHYKCGALPTELHRHKNGGSGRSRTYARGFGDRCATITLLTRVVGAVGIEPTTNWLKASDSTIELRSERLVGRSGENRTHLMSCSRNRRPTFSPRSDTKWSGKRESNPHYSCSQNRRHTIRRFPDGVSYGYCPRFSRFTACPLLLPSHDTIISGAPSPS